MRRGAARRAPAPRRRRSPPSGRSPRRSRARGILRLRRVPGEVADTVRRKSPDVFPECRRNPSEGPSAGVPADLNSRARARNPSPGERPRRHSGERSGAWFRRAVSHRGAGGRPGGRRLPAGAPHPRRSPPAPHRRPQAPGRFPQGEGSHGCAAPMPHRGRTADRRPSRPGGAPPASAGPRARRLRCPRSRCPRSPCPTSPVSEGPVSGGSVPGRPHGCPPPKRLPTASPRRNRPPTTSPSAGTRRRRTSSPGGPVPQGGTYRRGRAAAGRSAADPRAQPARGAP